MLLTVKAKLQPSARGIDYRYLEDYLRACKSWQIVTLVNGDLIFLGIPKEESIIDDSE
jgi:hypothetical protein